MQLAIVEFSKAVFGTIALIGKEILVRFKSPLINFLPMSLIISFPMDLIFSTCDLLPQTLPPFECPSSCRWSPSFSKNLFRKVCTCIGWLFIVLLGVLGWCNLSNLSWSQRWVILVLLRFIDLRGRILSFWVILHWPNRLIWKNPSTSN